MISKVIGIISYFPEPDTEYHAFVRKQRIKRCSELLLQIGRLWPGVDIIIVAQNWKNYKLPKIPNRVSVYHYDRLGILKARQFLRAFFLDSEYDYLIMLDDDAVIKCDDPTAYLQEIDRHPSGVGVIRHTDHPLQLMAISRLIYSQVPMVNVDVEQGQGFEGDVFVAECFTQFADKAFDFPEFCIREISHKDLMLPSTWRGDAPYNWDHMIDMTTVLVAAARRKVTNTTGSDTAGIDVLIPYVNCEDPGWLSEFKKAVSECSPSAPRFRDWGTLKYLLRGIAEYMPFVRDVILIVAQESQIPDWLDRDKVRIVYHSDFIPAEHLPTFNSCTIEAYLFNITKLSERFIYFNDDIFPIGPMSSSDFFTWYIPHLSFRKHMPYQRSLIFSNQCRAGLDMITNMLNMPDYPQDEIMMPEHTAMPMLRTTLDLVSNSCKNAIESSITPLRSAHNINQYIYHYYQYCTNTYIDDFCPYLYTELKDNLDQIADVLLNNGVIRLLCLNDIGESKDYDSTRGQLLAIFDKKFPDKSRFEL